MSDSKFHHYVPRFYLSEFTNNDNKIWVYDKERDKTFPTAPENIAGINHFYRIEEFEELGYDPLTMEKQLSHIEGEACKIFKDWNLQLTNSPNLIISEENRDIISLYITLQLLRTPEAREQIIQLSLDQVENYDPREDQTGLHISLLWDEKTINLLKGQISACFWFFGKNNSNTPFYTSDHPVLIKSFDHSQWILGPRVFDSGMYIVFPLSESLIMYCYEPTYWSKLKMFENRLTPVEFTDDMVNHENSGQIGMSYRFIFSNNNNFEFAKEFLSENSRFKRPLRDRI